MLRTAMAFHPAATLRLPLQGHRRGSVPSTFLLQLTARRCFHHPAAVRSLVEQKALGLVSTTSSAMCLSRRGHGGSPSRVWRLSAQPQESDKAPADSTSEEKAEEASAETTTETSAKVDDRPWETRMAERYGEGTYPLFRAVYKDLCEEMRYELYTKAPSTIPTRGSVPPDHRIPGSTRAPKGSEEPIQTASTTTTEDAVQPKKESPRARATFSTESSPPSATFAKGEAKDWSVRYHCVTNTLVFERPPRASSANDSDAQRVCNAAHVMAYAKVEVRDPTKINAILTFLDWCPVEVFILRDDVVVHFSMACNEGGMHMRNVRVYDAHFSLTDTLTLEKEAEMWRRQHREESGVPDPEALTSSPASEKEWQLIELFKDPIAGPAAFEKFRHWLYDGPCLWHLELDMQNELYDLMQDYEITLDWVRWVHEWIFYYEHRLYTRWTCGVLHRLIPPSLQGGEEDYLTEEERVALDTPASDWIREPLN